MSALDSFFESLKQASSRWDEVLVSTPERTLTKQDVFNYYSDPKVRKQLFEQLRAGPAIVHQQFALDRSALKRHQSGSLIHIKDDGGSVDDPRDYQYWIERRALEFHPTIGKKTDRVWVDLDPQDGVPWDLTRKTTGRVADYFYDHPAFDDVSIQFSGGRGFYVVGHLNKPIDTGDGRRLVHEILKPLTDEENLTTGLARPGQIRLDTTTLQPSGSVRGLYSLNSRTGLVSIPVTREWLDDFTPESATIESVLGYKPKKIKPFRV